MTKLNERAQRGKYAEKEVKKVLERWNTQFSDFTYHRLPDTRSARNFLKAQPADFLYFNGNYGGFIEAKETEHNFRLAKDNISQLPTLKKFAMANAASIVIVYHTELKQWRIARLEFFGEGVPSWDLTSLPLYPTAEQAMNSINWR